MSPLHLSQAGVRNCGVETIVDCVGDVIFRTDCSGYVKFLNRAWARLTGYSLEESLESGLFGFFDPEKRRPLREGWDRLAAGEVESVREECGIEPKDSRRRRVELAAWPCLGANGRVTSVAGIIRDIGDWRLRDATAAEIHDALLQPDLPAALHTVAVAVQSNLSVDACQIWLYHSREEQVQLCARAGANFPGDALALRVANQGRPEIGGHHAAFPVFSGAAPEAVVAIFSELEISSSLAQLAGSLAAGIGYGLKNRKQEEKFRAVFHLSSEAIFLLDETGIVDCNRAALDALGCPDQLLMVGRHPAEFSPELQPDGVPSMEKRREFEQLALERGAVRFEWMFRDSRGHTFPLEVNLTRVQLGGRCAFLVAAHEIASRKAQEGRLAQAKDQAELASRAKSVFMARVSQQVRAPLNGILNASRFLLDSELPSKQRVLVGSIGHTSRDALALLNHALDLSRMQTGELRLVSAPFDLRLAVEDVVELLAPKANAKGIDLALHYSCRLPRRAVGDAGRVRQILIHTVEHAIQRTDDGHVSIHIAPTLEAEHRLRLAVTIEDTGSANSGESEGLGLTLARELVQYMGGALWLTGEPGYGNRLGYKILLDRDSDEWPARWPSVAGLERRVLLVGPNTVVRDALVETLGEWGLKTRVATLAQEALAWLTSHSAQLPDLVLVSSRVSGMSWEEFGRRLMVVTGKTRPVLALLVGSSETVLSAEAIEAGWDAVSLRNIRIGALLDLLERTPGGVASGGQLSGSGQPIRRTILVATEDTDTFSSVSALAGVYNLSCDRAGSVESAVEMAKQRRPDLAIVDFPQEAERLPQIVETIRMGLPDCTIPIIIVTPPESPEGRRLSHALPGCERLTRPVRMEELDRLLGRVISGPTLGVFNQDDFLERCGGDSGMARDLSAAFRGLLPSLMSRLMESTGTQNPAAILDCTRRLRAAAATFSAELLMKACDRLTGVTELRDWGELPAVASVVKAEAGRLAAQLPGEATQPVQIPAAGEEVAI